MKSIEAIISSLRIAMTDARQNESHFESWMILNEAICDAIDALAKQPAQQCNHCNGSGRMVRDPDIGTDQECFVCEGVGFIKPEQPAQQQEPVAQEWRYYFIHSGATGKPDEVVGPCFTDRKEVAFGVGCFDQTALYPPANANAGKPWVGLTDEEMRDLEKQFNAERVRTSDEEYLIIYPGDYWAWQRAIEAKLREKNA